ncbi:MAG: hypothetical protein OXF25_09745 [Cyanobacteria bacterium MAG CAR3_bin_5]|nr:hypothetical protein [Cyanobacteria bacterium MAG CAR3_bin_5]MCY4236197.1 hypothetical protein [Cyanobacteria bacterium MAG CAR2_bin_4]
MTTSALRVTAGIAGLLTLGLGAMPALAIPEADAIRKLEAVAVHVVVNGEGGLIFHTYDYMAVDGEGRPVFPFYQQFNQLALPMFMTAEQARQAQETLEREGRPDAEGSRVVALPLNSALEQSERLVQEIKARDESQSLITPLVPAMADWRKAEQILRAERYSRQEIAQTLKVPIFFTIPPITITPPGTEEAKIALFFNYSQLQEAKQAVPDFDGQDRVWDLRKALNVLVQDEEDRYFFVPTVDLIQSVQDQQEAAPEEAGQE